MEERNVAVRGRAMMNVRVSNSPHLLALCFYVLKNSESKLIPTIFVHLCMRGGQCIFVLCMCVASHLNIHSLKLTSTLYIRLVLFKLA